MYIYYTFSNFLVQKYKLVSEYPRKKTLYFAIFLKYAQQVEQGNNYCPPMASVQAL